MVVKAVDETNMDNEELFNYLVATDQLDEFLGYKEEKDEEQSEIIVDEEDEDDIDSNED